MSDVDDLLASITGFLSPQAGQARRQWLDDQTNALMYYVPPEVRPQLDAVASMTPAAAYGDSVAASRRMMDGTASPGERWQAAGDMAAGVLGIVAPGYIAGKAGAPIANALGEMVTGYSGPARNALTEFGAAEDGGIRLWHGSPHDFDRFDMSKIGTGEGAQAYGHGLYFAEKKGIAESYRDTLSQKYSGVSITPKSKADEKVKKHLDAYLEDAGWDDIAGLRSAIINSSEQYDDPDLLDAFDEMVSDGRIEFLGPLNPGRLYEVDVNANPEDFLNWDAPLSEQPQKVRDQFSSLGTQERLASVRGEDAYHALGSRMGSKATAADALREAGIPGIRYLDAGSRGAGDGSRNYVVFDDSIISILKKYGLLPAAMMGGAAMQPGQAQAGPATPPRADMGATGRW